VSEIREDIKAALLDYVRAELTVNALTGEPYVAVRGLNAAADAILALLDARQGGGDREGVGDGSLRRPSVASQLGSGGNRETREGMSSKGGERR
jgi:hypothetical protein